ncbi:MAG: hypothetical protein BWY69_01192 [Planctomycetes bacterium ADurb.Bin401]|nr:MAG: hypothetical protein BWY69_01192 [Planctomycetes bacterium ADurb.Bin401]
MIYFDCPKCGKWFSVPDNCGGKKGKCPQCKSAVAIPASDKQLLPAELVKPKLIHEEPQRFVNTLNEEFKNDVDAKNTKRKYLWFIDVFFYPLNANGISMIFIMAGIPFLIMCISFFMLPWPVLGLFISMVGSLILMIINLYAYFYICQCVRNSAQGYVRLCVNVSEYSSLGETFFMMLRIIGCFFLFFAPCVIRLINNEGKTDNLFYYLLAAGAALFPISLLSVVMYDSVRGLNPVLLIKSILKTFFHYAGLVVVLWAGLFVIGYTRIYFIKAFSANFVLFTLGVGIARFIKIYLLMVAAHLLGRYYYKNAERLNWEV